MPRASDYLFEGHTYHLTHRCHDREFLLRFARDRDLYRKWLVEGVRRHRVPVFGYCITSNHVHVIAAADETDAISDLMHLPSGSVAKHYNTRKDRLGAMWEHPYQCTAIQDGRHLMNCLCYVHMNMVRAGVVSHPREWKWCGHDELMGRRSRYRVMDLDRLAECMELSGPEEVRELYVEVLATRMESNRLEREPSWTESLAVGTKGFVDELSARYTRRQRLHYGEVADDTGETWMVSEPGMP